MVGCVIARDGEVVGEGWHEELGGPHAEVNALARAGERARGSTAYVSLEPCRHHGRTPPCSRALVQAGVRRVVFGAEDPSRDAGGGGAELEREGVEVVGPVLSRREARRENPAFFHRDPSRPWLALKLALSLDGKIAARSGERTLLSGSEAQEEVQRLRAGFDGILVGTATALVDDPRLTVRGSVKTRVPPRRIVLDARGRLSPEARVLTEGTAPTWILTGPEPPPGWRGRMEGAGARVLPHPLDEAGRVDLLAAMERLREEGIQALLCEGGGVLGSALLDEGLVDRLHLVLAPRFLGPGGVEAFPGARNGPPAGGWRTDPAPRKLGGDLWITLDRED